MRCGEKTDKERRRRRKRRKPTLPSGRDKTPRAHDGFGMELARWGPESFRYIFLYFTCRS